MWWGKKQAKFLWILEVKQLSQREDIVAVAAKEIGYKEYQNNNNKYGVWLSLIHILPHIIQLLYEAGLLLYMIGDTI